MLDGAVFACGVHGLQHHHDALFARRVQLVLQRGNARQVLLCISQIGFLILLGQTVAFGIGGQALQFQFLLSVETIFTQPHESRPLPFYSIPRPAENV